MGDVGAAAVGDRRAHRPRQRRCVPYINPSAPRVEVLQYLVDECLIDEQNAVRDGMGWPLVGEGPVPDQWVDGAGWFDLPEALDGVAVEVAEE